MSKIDCSNIYNFMSEWERRKIKEPDEGWISANGLELRELKRLLEDLQKWSDEHPRMTRKEKFKKMCEENGFENVTLCLNNVPSLNCRGSNCVDCFEYWNEEVDG